MQNAVKTIVLSEILQSFLPTMNGSSTVLEHETRREEPERMHCICMLSLKVIPESPEQIDSVPVGPLKVQIMSSVISMPSVERLSTHVMLGMMFSST